MPNGNKGGLYTFLFKKKPEKKKPRERNAITDTQLKESLANSAVSILRQGVDYEELAGTKVEFGYLFDIEAHGTEALFKITTDKTTVYFAVQGTKLLRLALSEALYEATVDGFLNSRKEEKNDGAV